MNLIRTLLLASMASVMTGTPAAQRAPGSDVPTGEMSPAEIQLLVDAYALVQAQEMLELNDADYSRFAVRLKDLQRVRRQNQREHGALMQGLARLAGQRPPADEALVRDRLNALESHDARAAAAIKQTYSAIDQVITLVQQARFRVLEEQMERRRQQLLLRANLAHRPRTPTQPLLTPDRQD